MAPKSSSGRRESGGKAQPPAQAAPREMTSEEILQSNIKVTGQIAQRGFMPEGAIYYSGTPEERTAFYEAVDRIYPKLPEGYGYSFQTRTGSYGRKNNIIQVEVVGKYEKYDYKTRKMKSVRWKSGIPTIDGRIRYSEDEFLSRAALRGYAKAQVYKAAGLIYDPKIKGASAKYPALDSSGNPRSD